MKNPRLLFWLGIIVIVLPLLGIPQTWKHLVLFIVGLTLVAMSLVTRSRAQDAAADEVAFAKNEEELMDAFHTVDAHTRMASQGGGYTSQYDGPSVISEDVSHTQVTNQYDVLEDEPTIQLVYADDSLDEREVEDVQTTSSATDIYGFSGTVVEDVVPPKKPRKKRVSKKATIQNEMENPVLVSGDVADIIDDIEETFDGRN